MIFVVVMLYVICCDVICCDVICYMLYVILLVLYSLHAREDETII